MVNVERWAEGVELVALSSGRWTEVVERWNGETDGRKEWSG